MRRAATMALGILAPAVALGGSPYPKRKSHSGASKKRVAAVEAALDWLKRHQNEDGSWSAASWSERCEGSCSGGQGRGKAEFDVGVTSLALLAFLGHGETTRSKTPYRGVVQRGFAWLRAQQRDGGAIGWDPAADPGFIQILPKGSWERVDQGPIGARRQGGRADIEGKSRRMVRDLTPEQGWTIYNHALSTLALSEAYGMSGDSSLEGVAKRAIEWCIVAQNPDQGWGYGLKPGKNNTSLTVWMTLALQAARDAGMQVKLDEFADLGVALAGSEKWLAHVTDDKGWSGYLEAGGQSSAFKANDGKYDTPPVLSLATVACRLRHDEVEGGVKKGARKITDLALSNYPPEWDPDEPVGVQFLYWFFASSAMRQVGGRDAKKWDAALEKTLLARQEQEDCAKGSWEPVGPWCLAGGRVYAVAMGALALEGPYRMPKGYRGKR